MFKWSQLLPRIFHVKILAFGNFRRKESFISVKGKTINMVQGQKEIHYNVVHTYFLRTVLCFSFTNTYRPIFPIFPSMDSFMANFTQPDNYITKI